MDARCSRHSMFPHMPSLPVISGGEVVRGVQRLGFSVVRQRGSHIVLRKGSQE